MLYRNYQEVYSFFLFSGKPKNSLSISSLNSNTDVNSNESLTQKSCTDNVSYINHSVEKIDEKTAMINSSEIDGGEK